MEKDTYYNIIAVILGVGGPILSIFFFKKAYETAHKELQDVG